MLLTIKVDVGKKEEEKEMENIYSRVGAGNTCNGLEGPAK
jgi:hypothetical protein